MMDKVKKVSRLQNKNKNKKKKRADPTVIVKQKDQSRQWKVAIK
jgi:hypothetical protein